MQRQCWSDSIDYGSYAGRWNRSPSSQSDWAWTCRSSCTAAPRSQPAGARRLSPLGGSSLGLVLVNPKFPVSTAEMYGRVTPAVYSDGGRARLVTRALATHRPDRVAASLYNGLEPAARAAYPQIEQMRAALVAAGALGAVMSGSGPTVFGIARSGEQARQIRARVTRGSWECWAVRTLRGAAIRIKAT